MIDVFNNMWGSSKIVLTYREEERRQPQGFRPKQLMVTALNPRMKILYGLLCLGGLQKLRRFPVKEVEALKQMPPLSMVKNVYNCQEIVPDPLQWWPSGAHDFLLLVPLAWRVPVILVSQAQSERLFSSAGLIVTQRCNSRSVDNVNLPVFLRNPWAAVDAKTTSRGAAQPPVRIS